MSLLAHFLNVFSQFIKVARTPRGRSKLSRKEVLSEKRVCGIRGKGRNKLAKEEQVLRQGGVNFFCPEQSSKTAEEAGNLIMQKAQLNSKPNKVHPGLHGIKKLLRITYLENGLALERQRYQIIMKLFPLLLQPMFHGLCRPFGGDEEGNRIE